MLELTDDKGGRIIVPSASIGYVTTGAERKTGVASASTEGAFPRTSPVRQVRFASPILDCNRNEPELFPFITE